MPFLEVAEHLELPPCATYAALNLWNYSTISPNADLTCVDNLSVTLSLTGTKDEEWFFMISVAMEARGAQVVQLMLDTIQAVTVGDHQRVAAYLNQISEGFHELSRILERMYEKCRPAVFFHQLRPYLAGSKNMASAGLPSGLFYDVGDGKGEWRQYSGGSNAQSSLIQAFDVFLGVEHSAMGSPTKAELPKAQPPGKTPYIQVCNDSCFSPISSQILTPLTGNAKLHARPSPAIPRDAHPKLECPGIRDGLQARFICKRCIQLSRDVFGLLPRQAHPDCRKVHHYGGETPSSRVSACTTEPGNIDIYPDEKLE